MDQLLDHMNLFDHISLWRSALDVLWQEQAEALTGRDRHAIQEELQTCIEALQSARQLMYMEPATLCARGMRFRRVVDRLAGGYLQTDGWGLIRRANQAAFTLLNWPLDFRERLTGLPVLSFIGKEDRRAFHAEFLNLRQRNIAQVREWLVRLQPLSTDPMLVSLFAERFEDGVNHLVGITWIITKVYPCETMPTARAPQV